MKNKKVWIPLLTFIILLAIAFVFKNNFLPQQNAITANAQSPRGEIDPSAMETTTIRPAENSAQVSASGNITVQDERPVVVRVDGIVTDVTVNVGDGVQAGDILLTLDSASLARTVARAELNLESAQTNLDKLLEDADSDEVASAQANLVSAQENLLDVKAGAGVEEIAAVKASLASAQARYQDLLDGLSDAELVQLSAAMEKAQKAVEEAQWNYDKISYSDTAGKSPQATQLYQATIDYESAKAAYDIATEPASTADLQSAWSSVQSAQNQLDTLIAKPTAAELASAEAQVANATASLNNLLNGADSTNLQSAQISVDKAQLDLEEAQENLAYATLHAPIAGTVLTVNAAIGKRLSPGITAVTLADISALELTVNVAEVDISNIELGQRANITIDAIPDESFGGEVTQISPASSSEQGVVNYAVTISLTDENLHGVRAGMTAVATVQTGEASDAAWLVPTSAVKDRNGNSMVLILRNGQPTPVSVEKLGTQGEWTIVQSAELQAGDEALGGVSSFINQNEGGGFMGGGRPPGLGGGRP